MTLAQGFSLLAFIVLVVVTVVRMPTVVRAPTSRLAWLATLSGCAAFATVGIVVPLAVLDSWMGGTNVVNLLRNLFAAMAFWFLMRAALTLDGTRFTRRSWWELPAMLVAITVPFLLIPDRGPTSDGFIKENADKFALWAYASIYMGCVIVIMIRLLIGIRGRRPRQYVLIRVGAWMISVASTIELVYLTGRLVGAEPRAAIDLLGMAFVVPFYGGVILAAIGLAAFAFVHRTRSSVLTALRVLLLRANAVRGLEPHNDRDPDEYDTYRLAVRLTDIANSEPLNWRERTVLRAASRMLDRQMDAPAVVRMSSLPGALQQ